MTLNLRLKKNSLILIIIDVIIYLIISPGWCDPGPGGKNEAVKANRIKP